MSAGALITVIGGIADVLLPIIREQRQADPGSPAADSEVTQAATRAAQEVAGHMDVLLADARSGTFYQAGWRPAFGWLGVAALVQEWFIRPYALALFGLPLPGIPAEFIWPLITGVLGIAGLRTFEKKAGVADSAGRVLGQVIAGAARRAGK